MRKNIEEAKIKEENNIKSIKDLDAKFPRQKKKIAELEEKVKSLSNEVNQIDSECQKYDVKLMEVKSELAQAETLAMSEQEIDGIVSAKKMVERELEEQDQITSHGRQKFKETSHAIEEGIKITTKMEALHTSFSNIKTADKKTKTKQLDDLKIEVIRLQSDKSRDVAEIEDLAKKTQFKEANIEEFTKKQTEIERSYRQEDKEQKKEIKQKKNTLRKLSSQESALATANQQLLDKQALTFTLAANVLKIISTQTFADD